MLKSSNTVTCKTAVMKGYFPGTLLYTLYKWFDIHIQDKNVMPSCSCLLIKYISFNVKNI